MTKLSIAVLVYNEEHRLADCLKTLDFADELVVLLNRCTDRSKEIALEYTSNIVEGCWPIEGPRRMKAIEACSGDWILELDVDERVSPALIAEIRKCINSAEFGYVTIPFDNYIDGRLIKRGWGCSWGINAKNCLFSKGAKIWGDQRVHPKIEMKGKHYTLKSSITHYIFNNVSDMIARFNSYTSLRAEDMMDNPPENETMKRNVRRILSRFYKCYFRRKGYKEGVFGFLNALFAGLYPLISFLKYQELRGQAVAKHV
jgi:glycosyltransferase involved in cell wall biosynthesis